MKRNISILFLMVFVAIAAACGGAGVGSSMVKVVDKKVSESLTVTLSSSDGKMMMGAQDVILSFTDSSNKPVAIEKASLNFNMPAMGSMSEMNSAAELTTTGTPGEFKGKVDLEMAGDWQAQVSYEGVESGKVTLAVTAR